MDEDAGLRACFDQAVTGLAIVRPDGRILEANPALGTMLGYGPDAWKGRRLAHLMAADHWCRLAELIQEIGAGKRVRGRMTLECRHRSGRSLRSRIHVSRVADPSGSGARFLVQFQDISGLIRTEAELEGSRQRYRALSDATFEAVFISRKGICIDANRTASTMFQTPREELIGIFGTDVIAPEYKALVKANMLSGFEGPYRAVAVKKDGTRFHVMIQGKMTRIGDQDVRVTVVRDVDAQIKAEAALKESERHLRSLIEGASNFVLFRLRHDPDNPCCPRKILISPSISELVDRSRLVDFQSWLELVHPEDRELLQAAGRNMLDTCRLDETIRFAERGAGGWRWL
ncbi:MAG TPA: PAS domain S-box protein, partial [Desulfosarcina sp.]|nr:PAS domain S-box protein [Desulfosarcina sp.]